MSKDDTGAFQFHNEVAETTAEMGSQLGAEYLLKHGAAGAADLLAKRFAENEGKDLVSEGLLLSAVNRWEKISISRALKLVLSKGKDLISKGTKVGEDILEREGEEGELEAGACAAGGPVGCVVGAGIDFLLTAFTLVQLLSLFYDPKKLLLVFNKEQINNLSNTLKNSLREAYSKYNMDDWFDEEITFTPETFVFKISDTGDLELTDDWGPKYNKYMDEYIAKQGIKPGWRDRITQAQINELLGIKKKSLKKWIIIIGIVICLLVVIGLIIKYS